MADRGVERHDEAEPIDRARRGDHQAFAILVRTHQHGVFTLALRIVGNRETAADVAQDAFVRAWRALPRFRGDAAFSTWLHRITVNTASTARRRVHRDSGVPLDDVADRLEDGGMTPERAGENADLRGALRDALDELPRGLRAVVVLKDVYGWSHREVADALGITVTAAKVRLHRARRKLQARLGPRV